MKFNKNTTSISELNITTGVSRNKTGSKSHFAVKPDISQDEVAFNYFKSAINILESLKKYKQEKIDLKRRLELINIEINKLESHIANDVLAKGLFNTLNQKTDQNAPNGLERNSDLRLGHKLGREVANDECPGQIDPTGTHEPIPPTGLKSAQ
jgi:hypothetical protein